MLLNMKWRYGQTNWAQLLQQTLPTFFTCPHTNFLIHISKHWSIFIYYQQCIEGKTNLQFAWAVTVLSCHLTLIILLKGTLGALLCRPLDYLRADGSKNSDVPWHWCLRNTIYITIFGRYIGPWAMKRRVICSLVCGGIALFVGITGVMSGSTSRNDSV